MNISIRMASSDGDLGHARNLCQQWLDWHWKNYPADWPTDDNPAS